MRFCECVQALSETKISVSDFGIKPIQERFYCELKQQGSQRIFTTEHYLYEVSNQEWKLVTNLSVTTRNLLTILLARGEFPTSMYIEKYGWVILYSEGSIRDLLFAKFKIFTDARLARKEQIQQNKDKRMHKGNKDDTRAKSTVVTK